MHAMNSTTLKGKHMHVIWLLYLMHGCIKSKGSTVYTIIFTLSKPVGSNMMTIQ